MSPDTFKEPQGCSDPSTPATPSPDNPTPSNPGNPTPSDPTPGNPTPSDPPSDPGTDPEKSGPPTKMIAIVIAGALALGLAYFAYGKYSAHGVSVQPPMESGRIRPQKRPRSRRRRRN